MKVHALEGVITAHDAITREVETVGGEVGCYQGWGAIGEGARCQGSFVGGENDDVRSICTIALDELESVKEDEEQIARQE